jgi:hypothetical protein
MEELVPSECWALLRTTAVGRLAMHCGDDDVDIFPVNFVVDHGSVVFRTAAGTKLAHALTERPVTFEADDSDLATGVAWSVVAKGPSAVIQVRRDVIDAFDLELQPWHAGRKPAFVRLVPEQITGRRFTIDPTAL